MGDSPKWLEYLSATSRLAGVNKVNEESDTSGTHICLPG